MATVGGFLFGYDQGVVGNVLVLERFGSDFPRFFADENVKVRGAALFPYPKHYAYNLGMVRIVTATRGMVRIPNQRPYCRQTRSKTKYYGAERTLPGWICFADGSYQRRCVTAREHY
jgi:hypothetical protein